MKIKTKIKLIIIFLLLNHNYVIANKNNINTINSINPGNKKIKLLRKDIKKTILTVKSKRDHSQLPSLKFYQYIVKEKDTFWKILAQTSLNIDTLFTVNSLNSPKDIKVGKRIFITNMRGIIYRVKPNDTLKKISKTYKVESKYILKVNKIKNLSKKHIFIPCAHLTKIERSLFLGTGFASPLKYYRKTSGFGVRLNPFHKRKLNFHKGIDLACKIGTPVYASLSGTIEFCGYKQGYGKIVIIKHYHNYQTYYGHLSKFKVKKGQKVERGQLIALSGNTGRTTGPHLHFEVRKKRKPVNPGILLR